MSQLKVGIIGCQGRMGKALTDASQQSEDINLIGGTTSNETPDVIIKEADVIFDFTTPEATVNHAALAAKYGTSLIVGTTGLSADDEAALKSAAVKIAIVYASNFSTGVNLLFYVTELMASKLDESFDIEINGMHHRDKVDAPSGTALSFGHFAAKGRGKELENITRDNIRKKGDIGFTSLRGGNVAGEHTISFNANDERVEISHKAGSSEIFASGAIKAALWVADKPAGLYDMADVLDLK